MSEVLVERPGLFTIVVDRGRFGYRDVGVTWGGPMDAHAFESANAALGNGADAAALEITLGNATFRFDTLTEFVLTGADCHAQVNGAPVEHGAVTEAQAGVHLMLGQPGKGLRTYLAVSGGFDVPSVMGSRTTDVIARFGGYNGRALTAGDRLKRGEPGFGGRHTLAAPKSTPGHVRLMPGGEFEHFSPEAQALLFTVPWKIHHDSNRMGYRLEGAPLSYSGLELHSHAVFPGVVQVPPNGNPIVLMADANTTGGYPKVGVVAPEDLSILAQLRPGDSVSFVQWKPS